MTPRQKLATTVGGAAAALATSAVVYFEGYSPTVAPDPIGRLQVCYGHDDQSMRPGTRYTPQECSELLAQDLERHAEAVIRCAGPVSLLGPNRTAAAISFAYNVGAAKFCSSTFARKLKASDPAACAELSAWVWAGGRDCRVPANGCAGIATRRSTERALCEGRPVSLGAAG